MPFTGAPSVTLTPPTLGASIMNAMFVLVLMVLPLIESPEVVAPSPNVFASSALRVISG